MVNLCRIFCGFNVDIDVLCPPRWSYMRMDRFYWYGVLREFIRQILEI